MEKGWLDVFKLGTVDGGKNSKNDNILLNEENAKKMIKEIQNLYGKNFIENVLNNKIKNKKYNKSFEVREYYEFLKKSFPNKTKKELRLITAKKFKISEKTVQRHIYN